MQQPVMTPSRSRHLLALRLSLVLPALAPEDKIFVLDAYSEPWRAYHNADHILKIFRLLDETPTAHVLTSSEKQALDCMIIYHDVVYKIMRGTKAWSETQSAFVATLHLTRAGLPAEIIYTTSVGILATETHTFDMFPTDVGRVPATYLLDLDLVAGLGQSWEEFSANTELVWQEFQPAITRKEFDLGRAAWAKTFLQRPKIFHTVHFAHLEDSVRDNLRQLAAR